MIRPHSSRARVLLFALCLAVPALAAAPPGSNDAANSGIDGSGADVTRHAMPPPDVTKPVEPIAVSANPLWAVPLSALAATRNRPLFTPSRRPPAPIVANAPVAAPLPPPPSPAAPQHPNLVLVGTVAGDNESMAVFIDAATRDTIRLRTGEGHLGWILQSVDRRTVTMKKGDQTETLELPRPTALQGPAPVITALPPPPSPPPQSNAPASVSMPKGQGCAPEPIGC
jgi:general secretion pathway protein N